MTPLLLLLALAACAHVATAVVPVTRCPSGPELHSVDGTQPDHRACALVELLHPRALAACPEASRPLLEERWRQAWITWHSGGCRTGGGFPCPGSGAQVAGCATTWQDLHVACLEAVPAEVAHLVWWSCQGRSGEAWTRHDDGSYSWARDGDYGAWVEAGKAMALQLDAGPAALAR